jgi:hypothetical protein
MKTSLFGKVLGACVLASLSLGSGIAAADVIENVTFTYTNPGSGNLTATGTLTIDLTTNQALSATGTITSDLFVNAGGPPTPMGPRSFFLVTAGNCAATSPNCNLGSGGAISVWADSDGTHLSGDTSFSLTGPYVSTAGLLFAVGNVNEHGTGGSYDSFNFWAAGGTAYGDFLGAGGLAQSAGGTQVWNNANSGGTFTITGVTAVPLPASMWLLLSALGGLALARGVRRHIPAADLLGPA